jgi:hypothetical protein
MARKTGRVTVTVDGNVLKSKPGASIKIGGVMREPIMDDQGGYNYTETLEPSQVKCTLLHVAETDLPALRAFVDGTVHYETDTGVSYVVTGAGTGEIGELANGEVEVTFNGPPAEQA